VGEEGNFSPTEYKIFHFIFSWFKPEYRWQITCTTIRLK